MSTSLLHINHVSVLAHEDGTDLMHQMLVLPYVSTCNRFLRILPNFALRQQGPHVSKKKKKETLAKWYADGFLILAYVGKHPTEKNIIVCP